MHKSAEIRVSSILLDRETPTTILCPIAADINVLPQAKTQAKSNMHNPLVSIFSKRPTDHACIRIRQPRHGKSQQWPPSCTYARASVQPNVLARTTTHTNSNQQKTLLLLYASTPARAETCICAVPSRPPKTLNTTTISHTLIASANVLPRANNRVNQYTQNTLTLPD